MSTKNRLLLLVSLSLVLLALGTGIFTKRSVEDTMLREQRQNAQNSVSLAIRTTERMFSHVFYYKMDLTMALRQYMQTVALPLKKITQKSKDPFQTLEGYPLPHDITLLVVNRDGKIVFSKGDNAHLNPYNFLDIKGQNVFESMYRQADKDIQSVTFVRIPDGTATIQYYGRHFYLPEADLLVGIWSDSSSLEKKYTLRIEECIADLQYYFQDVRLGSSGCLFVLHNDGRIVTGPKGMQMKSANGGPSLLDFVREAAVDPTKPLIVKNFDFIDANTPREALLFAGFSKELKMYTGGVVYLDEARAPGHTLSFSLVLGSLASMLIILPLAVWFTNKATLPLGVLARYARKIPEEDFMSNAIPSVELQQIARGRDKDVSELARSFLLMDFTLRSRVRALMDATMVRERMQSELNTAMEIQTGFLPAPLSPEVCANRFSLAASLVPAREVGGDLYDFFLVDGDRLCFIIGDVSGKGIPAALFMSITLTLIRANHVAHATPESLTRSLNESLTKDNSKCMFVTLFIGVLDLNTGEMLYTNAGHNPPILLRTDGTVSWLEGLSGPVLGAVEDIDYTLLTAHLQPGDALFMYTDGLNEAMNAANQQYGNERMLHTLAHVWNNTPEEILAAMSDDVAKHAAGNPPSDDLSMLCLRYCGVDLQKENAC